MKSLAKKSFYILTYFIPVILLGYLLYQNTKPILEVEYELSGKNALIPELVPLARVGDKVQDGFGSYRSISDEPVYLDVRLPRKYNNVEVEVEYSDLNVPLFEVGVSRDYERRNFDFITLENKDLDTLNWNKVEKDGLVLYQREKKYNNIDEFLISPPTFRNTLIYRTELEPRIAERFKIGETVLDFPIKKRVKLFAYHLGGELLINVDANSDYQMHIFKDGDFVPDTHNLPKGIYKIELFGDENIVFDNIKINSPYVAILDSVSIGELDEELKLYSSTSRLLFKTESVLGIQDIFIDGEKIKIEEGFLQYEKKYKNRWLKELRIPNGELEINGSLIFIKHWDLFYPVYEKFYPGIDLDSIDFILAKYNSPESRGVIKKKTANFDISHTPTPYGKLRFLLSLPGADGGAVKIRGIKFHFTGDKFSVSDIINKIFSKIL